MRLLSKLITNEMEVVVVKHCYFKWDWLNDITSKYGSEGAELRRFSRVLANFYQINTTDVLSSANQMKH